MGVAGQEMAHMFTAKCLSVSVTSHKISIDGKTNQDSFSLLPCTNIVYFLGLLAHYKLIVCIVCYWIVERQ